MFVVLVVRRVCSTKSHHQFNIFTKKLNFNQKSSISLNTDMDMVFFKFKNRHINERQNSGLNVNIFYSTPSCYLKAVHDSNISFEMKHDDFFPYASDPHSFWTGYFTSRPTLKRFERIGNHYLQVCLIQSECFPFSTNK